MPKRKAPANDEESSILQRKRTPNTRWDDTDLDTLILRIREAKAEGKMGDNGFKRVVWEEAATRFTDPLNFEDSKDLPDTV